MVKIQLLTLEWDFSVKKTTDEMQLIRAVHLKITQLSCGSVNSDYQTSSDLECDSLGCTVTETEHLGSYSPAMISSSSPAQRQ